MSTTPTTKLDELYNIFTEAFIENSSVIIAVLFTSLTFIYQNFTGIVYLGFLLAAMVIRGLFIWGFDIGKNTSGAISTIKCIQPYGFNVGFSTFVFMFTFCYAFIPMFVYNDINIPLLIIYIVYFVIDLGFKTNKYIECENLQMNLTANFVAGAGIGAIFSTSMLKLSSEFLFFNELSSSKEICSVKKEQAFKCKVNK
jgi:hypothetical protein